METSNAISALTALGHATRLAAFRLLVEAGPTGRAAGDIGTALQVPPATLSFHLKELVQAGLVESESQGRHVLLSRQLQCDERLDRVPDAQLLRGLADRAMHARRPRVRVLNPRNALPQAIAP